MPPTDLMLPLIGGATYLVTNWVASVWPWPPTSATRKAIPLVAVVLATLLTVTATLVFEDALTVQAVIRGVVLGLATVWIHAVRKAGDRPVAAE